MCSREKMLWIYGVFYSKDFLCRCYPNTTNTSLFSDISSWSINSISLRLCAYYGINNKFQKLTDTSSLATSASYVVEAFQELTSESPWVSRLLRSYHNSLLQRTLSKSLHPCSCHHFIPVCTLLSIRDGVRTEAEIFILHSEWIYCSYCSFRFLLLLPCSPLFYWQEYWYS